MHGLKRKLIEYDGARIVKSRSPMFNDKLCKTLSEQLWYQMVSLIGSIYMSIFITEIFHTHFILLLAKLSIF